MFSWVGKKLLSCGRVPMNRDEDEGPGGEGDALLWSRDLEKHAQGEFSFAAVQANEVMEDHSEVQTGQTATFVGVYDGHGGPDASTYISSHLYKHLLRAAGQNRAISEISLTTAFADTENGFLDHVRRARSLKPEVATAGSCCLVGVIWNGMLFVANLGDSRAVMGSLSSSKRIVAEQLTSDQNVCMMDVRNELIASHPNDPDIVTENEGAWRIKGIIQVSRTIGDAYLKSSEFAPDPSSRFRLPQPLVQPVLRADPATFTREIRSNDRFFIFASDGLWEFLTNEEAVRIVHTKSRLGIARRLLVSALKKAAARSRHTSYDNLKNVPRGERRQTHDDITVIVIFVDQKMDGGNSAPLASVRGFTDATGPSNFNF